MTIDITTNRSCVLLKPLTVEIRDAPVPPVGNDDVLVKIEATGICGSDVSASPSSRLYIRLCLSPRRQLHTYSHGGVGHNFISEPQVLGHESAGAIIKVGANVTSLKIGDRVAIEPTRFCRK